ncbi:ArdC family protein [Maribacter polysaccharolyticus]|uniref:ArdC family protein n=1 Tax=Maribacter polysaccharolyticus TaxID=3020831 RepID=UPI00237F20FA|nr:ArdC family protein [Maribacter polysaccharolyticus]MDE3744074.1 ArdC family protein [Maribacter polysaccharolyticus]
METTQEKKTMTKEDFYQKIFSAEGKDAKRALLKDLSNTAKLMLEMDPDAGDGVNDVILNKMYKGHEHEEFHTFNGWKELGFQVKKGSKSFFIWSKPRKVERKNEEKESGKDEFKMFGLAYLFSNAQVEPLKD